MNAPERITEYLVRDHERLHDLLARAGAGARFDHEAFAAFRVGLLRHIAIEEKLLLPAARNARGGEALSRAYDLRVEHAALTSLLMPPPNAALCKEIASILTMHDAREEGADGVYAECEALLSASESAELAARAESFREVRVVPHADSPRVYRTAHAALAAARRTKRPPVERATPSSDAAPRNTK